MRNVDFTAATEEDLIGVWLYTYETWGIEKADQYFDQIVSCCEAIGSGEARTKPVEGLPDNIHVASL
jgi:plasmid stabilization system protein ParE